MVFITYKPLVIISIIKLFACQDVFKLIFTNERIKWISVNLLSRFLETPNFLFLFERSGATQNLEAVVRKCSLKKVFLEILQSSQENTYARVSFLIKLQAWVRPVSGAGVFSGTLAQMFSSRFCEISESTFNTLKVLNYVIIFKWAY